MALETDALRRLRFSHELGLMYEGDRKIQEGAGYVSEDALTFSHYWSMYERKDVAGRIVDMPAQTTWRTPPDVILPGQEEGTEFTRQFTALAKRLHLWSRLERADRLSGIGRFGVLLIGVKEVDAKALKEPMKKLSGPDDVIYLSAFHEGFVGIKKWVTDPADPRFGMPHTYELDLASGVKEFEASGTSKVQVHHSRIIHIAEDLLADEVFGRPRLKRVMDRLFDLEKILSSTGEAYWQLASRILQLKIDPEAQVSDEDKKDLGEAMEAIIHDLRRQMVLKGGELAWLESTPPNPAETVSVYQAIIAAACGIPKRILYGTETGERASTQDERLWLGTINERQERFAEPGILRPFIDRLIEHKALTAPGKDGYEINWPPLYEATDQEKAETNKTRAETAKSLSPLGGNPLELVTIDDDGGVYLKSSEQIEEEMQQVEKEEGEEGGVTEGEEPEDEQQDDGEEA